MRRARAGSVVPGQALFHHGSDLAGHETLVARHRIRLLFDEKGHVWVLLEAVAHSIEVQVKTLLPEFSLLVIFGETFQIIHTG